MILKERKWVDPLRTAARILAATAAQADTSPLNIFPTERTGKTDGRTLQPKPARKWDRFVWAWLGVGFVWILLGYLFIDRLNTYLLRVM
jgi:hypothetical protein